MRPNAALLGSVGPPPPSRDVQPVRMSGIGMALVLLVAVLVGSLLYSAQLSGSLQWGLGVAGMGILAALAWRFVLRRTSEPGPLVGPALPDASRPGELGALARAVQRAARGLPYSQVTVSSRVRTAFLEHARLELGIAPEAMRDAQADPQALHRLIGDDILTEFLYLRVGDLEDAYGWVLRARGRGGFAPEFRDVLDRMEAWR